jgi:hypothetical protein
LPLTGRAGVLAFAAAIWASTLIHAVFPGEAGFIVLRATLSVMTVLWIATLIRSRAPILAMSPLLILAMIALLGYSIVEAVYASSPKAFSHRGLVDRATLSYPGSLGEALVLQFVAFCLFLTALIARFSPTQNRCSAKLPYLQAWATAACVAALSICIMLAVDVATALLPTLKEWRAVGIGKQLGDGIEPLSALGFAILAHAAATKGGRFTAGFFGLAVIYLAAKTTVGLVQMPLLIVAMATFYYLLNGRGGIRTTIIVFSCAAVVSTAVLFGIVQTRHETMGKIDGGFVEAVKLALWAKVILRQGRSASCYNKIVTDHRPNAADERPFYFASAIVPRALWPEKPALSLGHEYTVQFCGSPRLPKGGHYELVTLLAEPVLRGGWPGLATAQLFIGLALALVAFAMPRCRPVAILAIIALSPWLVHFQQSFALYFAGAVKMLLYMVPGIALLQWWTHRSRPAKPDTAPQAGQGN